MPGEQNGNHKLTTSQVVEIRASTAPHGVLARDFDVDPSTISDVKRRKTWRHIA